MSGLLPCPFCAGEAYPATVKYSALTVREQNWGQDTFHYATCSLCGSSNCGLTGHRTPELAAERWNRRAALAAPVEAEPVAQGDYRAMWESAMRMIGNIQQALGISDADASCATGDEEILDAIADLKASPSALQMEWLSEARAEFEVAENHADPLASLLHAADAVLAAHPAEQGKDAEDAARLDWLDGQKVVMDTISGKFATWYLLHGKPDESVREAIDAARNAKPAKGG